MAHGTALARCEVTAALFKTPEAAQKRRQHLKKELEAAETDMPPALLRREAKLAAQLDRYFKGGLQFQWLFGAELRKIRDNPKGIYGPDPIPALARKWRYHRSLLDKMIHFCFDFDKETVKMMSVRRSAIGGTRISWAHIEVLLTVSDSHMRRSLLESFYEEDWTPSELAKAHWTLIGGRVRAAGAGRPVKIPNTLVKRLETFDKFGGIIVRNEKAIWRHDEFGFLVSVEELPADKITPQLIQHLREDVILADQALSALSAVRGDLAQAAAMAESKAAEQARVSGKAAVLALVAEENGHAEKKRKR